MTVRDVIRILANDGWLELWASGGRRFFAHPAKRGVVTIAGKPDAGVPRHMLVSLLRQAGID